MSFVQALITIIGAGFGAWVVLWYLDCIRHMIFICERPAAFFSRAYPSSMVFLVLNVVLALCALAGALAWITN